MNIFLSHFRGNITIRKGFVSCIPFFEQMFQQSSSYWIRHWSFRYWKWLQWAWRDIYCPRVGDICVTWTFIADYSQFAVTEIVINRAAKGWTISDGSGHSILLSPSCQCERRRSCFFIRRERERMYGLQKYIWAADIFRLAAYRMNW
jgi:hypothetical protein